MPRLATAACVRMLAIVVGFALMEPDLLLAVIGPNDPASAEANTEWATVPDFVMRAPGRPGGFPFVDFYENESVSVASGGLVVAHPASPVYPLNGGQRLGLTRTYSSKICREDVYTREWIDDVGDTHHDHVHVWRGNSWAGFGWSFHLGRISYQSEKADPSDKDYANFLHFVEPDGTDHRLYEVVTDEFGTADGSYIRAARDPNDVYRVYFPDGRWLRLEKISDPTTTDIGRHHSNHIVTNPETHGWYTVEAGRGPHSLYTADYQKSDGYGHPEGLRSIHDNTGRQISFEIFVDPNRDPNQPAVDPSLYGMLKKVKTPAFGDRIADYDFEYNTFATDSNRDGATNLPLLTEVALPEGFSIGYEYADIALTPLISRIVHPSHSVSQFSWTGQDYSRGATSTGNSFGVSRRQVLDGQGNSFSWFFQRNVVNPASGRRDDVTLTDPYGNVTEYLLNADPNRPFSGRVSQVTVHQGGLNGPIASQTVSETMLACSASSKIVNYGPGTLLEADVRPFKVESRTFNVADANDVATVVRESSDWDGMGHFYKARVSGTGVKGYSETFTKWTADPNATNPASWLLDTFAYRDISNGGTRSRIGASFDAEGRLAETRAYRNIVGVNLDGGVSISSICECGRGGCPPCAPDPWTPPPSPPTCGLTPTFVVPADPNGPDPDDDLDLSLRIPSNRPRATSSQARDTFSPRTASRTGMIRSRRTLATRWERRKLSTSRACHFI